MINQYDMNQELKLDGETVIKLETLESLRKTWFELGYDVGYRNGKSGKKKNDKKINDAYNKIRFPYGEKDVD